MSSLAVTFVTPAEQVWHGQASMVVVPAVDGSFGILPKMQPTLAILGEGMIRLHSESGVEEFPVNGGFVSVDRDIVTIGVDELEGATAPVER